MAHFLGTGEMLPCPIENGLTYNMKVTTGSILVGIFMGALTVAGGVSSAQEPKTDLPPVRVRIADQSGVAPIALQQLTVKAVMVGSTATTALEMVFYNPNDQVLEGTFELPLAAGWAVTAMSLDIDGQLRPAVTVPKAVGRQAFEAVVRRGVDPALGEMVTGNLFRLRIYPFAPRGTRHLVLQLAHQLPRNNGLDLYTFPYHFEETIKEFKLSVRALERPEKPVEIQGLRGVQLLPARHELTTDYVAHNIQLKETLRIALPVAPTQEHMLQVKLGNSYFYAATVIPPAAPAEATRPHNLLLLWDASLSQGKDDPAKARAFMRSYLQWMGHGKVTLYVFSNRPQPPIEFIVQGGESILLDKYLEGIDYDGATDYSNLPLPWSNVKADAMVLVSNGIPTAPGKAQQLRPIVPLTTVSYTQVRNSDFLQGLATASKGQYIDLAECSVSEAMEQVQRGTTMVNAWGPTGQERPWPLQVTPDKPTVVYGRSAQPLKEVKVQGTNPGGHWEKTVRPDQQWDDTLVGAMVARAYYLQQIAGLRAQGQDEQAEQLARSQSIPTLKTSLIVLEQVADYAKYGITPPPALLPEYEALRKQQQVERDSAQSRHMAQLIASAEEQHQWWRGEVTPPEERNHPGPGWLRPRGRQPQRALNKLEGALEGVVVRGVAMTAADTGSEVTAEPAGQESNESPRSTIAISAWDPQSPYLKVLEYARKQDQVATYRKLKQEYGDVPSFYLDAAQFFFAQQTPELALRIASNLLELQCDAPELLSALAQLYEEQGLLAEAEAIYRQLCELVPYAPQPFRYLALVLARQGKDQEALELLYQVATSVWEERFRGIDLIALNELNALLDQPRKNPLKSDFLDKRLRWQQPVELRIVLTWSNNDTDVDLHVFTPDGEECYYGHRLTKQLGKLSNDITLGYGPEEFMQRHGQPGTYTVKARLFADHTQKALAPQYVTAHCYLHYGTPQQVEKVLRFRLEHVKDMVTIGTIDFQP